MTLWRADSTTSFADASVSLSVSCTTVVDRPPAGAWPAREFGRPALRALAWNVSYCCCVNVIHSTVACVRIYAFQLLLGADANWNE